MSLLKLVAGFILLIKACAQAESFGIKGLLRHLNLSYVLEFPEDAVVSSYNASLRFLKRSNTTKDALQSKGGGCDVWMDRQLSNFLSDVSVRGFPENTRCLAWGASKELLGRCNERWSFQHSTTPVLDTTNRILHASLDMASNQLSAAFGLFDVIIYAEGLQHVQHPALALQNLRRLLSPTGHLLIGTPFLVRDAVGRGSDDNSPSAGHFRYTGHGSLHLLTEAAGLQTVARYTAAPGLLAIACLAGGDLQKHERDSSALLAPASANGVGTTGGLYVGTLWHLKRSAPAARTRREPPQAQPSPWSFHVVVMTIGRQSIFRVLASIQKQLQPRDYVTVIYDGVDLNHTYVRVAKQLGKFGCNTDLQFGTSPMGMVGHARRRTMKHLGGDFVIHFDDDNYFVKDAFVHYRTHVQDNNTLYFFQSGWCSPNTVYTWRKPAVEWGNLDTANGVTPSWLNDASDFPLVYQGDFYFYQKAATLAKSVKFVPLITSVYTGNAGACPV